MKPWRRVGALALFVMTLTLVSTHAAAVERPWLRQSVEGKPAAGAGERPMLGKWGAALLLVGLSGYALWKGVRRRQTLPNSQSSAIRVGSVTRITPKAHLVVVSVNGRNLLLAVTDSNVTRLSWLDEASEIDPLESEQDRVDPSDFESAQPVRPATSTVALANEVRPVKSVRATHRDSLAAARAPSKFRDLLSDIIGVESKTATSKTSAASPAETLAATTVDHYTTRNATRANGAANDRALPAPTAMVNFEGQAAGLIARLNRVQP